MKESDKQNRMRMINYKDAQENASKKSREIMQRKPAYINKEFDEAVNEMIKSVRKGNNGRVLRESGTRNCAIGNQGLSEDNIEKKESGSGIPD